MAKQITGNTVRKEPRMAKPITENTAAGGLMIAKYIIGNTERGEPGLARCSRAPGQTPTSYKEIRPCGGHTHVPMERFPQDHRSPRVEIGPWGSNQILNCFCPVIQVQATFRKRVGRRSLLGRDSRKLQKAVRISHGMRMKQRQMCQKFSWLWNLQQVCSF